jgi:2-polyprenyl-3-methyl-5-hydroxy-6-metoxy-1,4-benzoquinol methylase
MNNQIYFDANREHWNNRVMPHLSSKMYAMEAFMQGNNSLNTIELDIFEENIVGKSLLHLQCHFGQDTLSWARMGAKVTGIDISPVAIEKAKELNATLGLDATFVVTDVYSVPANIEGVFDVVFTSYGCIVWLPDLDEWAQIIAQKLKPNGVFLMADFHPTLMLFNFDNQRVAYDYFNKGVIMEEQTHTYTGQLLEKPVKEYFWQHSLSEIIQALLKNGLQIVDFQEFDYSPYDCFPNMKARAEKEYIFGDFKTSFPHVFALKAVKK